MAPLLALKIDVDTWIGTRDGVPALVRMLAAHGADATFLFSLGPDHTGRALRRALRPGFLAKVARSSVLAHYGARTLLYGVLLPGPDIGRAAAAQMRAARDAGFECGIHAWDHVAWQDRARSADAAWTERTMGAAERRYREVFGTPSPTCGAAGWQMNPHAYARHEAAGYRYASDGRALLDEAGALLDPRSGPYRPPGARCIQMPTTLPTLDELLGRTIGGRLLGPGNVAGHLLDLTRNTRRDHVYTLHAELEGRALAPVFERLLAGWAAQGYRLVSMAAYHDRLRHAALPELPLCWGRVPGRSGELVVDRAAR